MKLTPLSCLPLEITAFIYESAAGAAARALPAGPPFLSAAGGPDKSRPEGGAVSGERKLEGCAPGLALRNDAISACGALSPRPQHKL